MPFRKAPRAKSSASATLFESRSESHPESPARFLAAHVDGGARGNPGPAGYGVMLRDQDGKTVAELSQYLGERTNNAAEYSGLLAALTYAVDHGHTALKVVSDSELMVRQLTGAYKVSNPELKQLYQQAQTLIRKLQHFEIRHVLRGQNKDADRLANLAMDRGAGRAAPAPAPEAQEWDGIVRNGVVELQDRDSMPEGTLVKVRAIRRS